jgi:hypothetical protein
MSSLRNTFRLQSRDSCAIRFASRCPADSRAKYLTSVVHYLLGYRENPESIGERSIDESFSTVLANSPRSRYLWIEIDLPLDSHEIHFSGNRPPKMAQKGSNRTQIKKK